MSYPGSKAQAGTWQRIIGQMPPHDVYVELFAGSAQVFRRKRPCDYTLLIDKSPAVVAALTEERAAIKLPRCQKPICADALEWLVRPENELPWRRTALIYADPPYVLSTRKGREYYEHEMTDLQHVQLITLLDTVECNVMLSGYPSAIYDQVLQAPKWRCLTYRTRTRGRTVTECLWMNFPEPDELHDYRFAGRTYRERQGLTKLRRRWLGKLDRMKPRTRNFILDAIHQHQLQRCVTANSARSGATEGET